MDYKIDVDLLTEDGAFVKSLNGEKLSCSVEIKNVIGEFNAEQIDESYLCFVWAACRYYGVLDITRLIVKKTIKDGDRIIRHTEQKRIDPSRLKVLMTESCQNCGMFGEDGCISDECVWIPRNGFVEITDDESRCSECGALASTRAIRCDNCLAVFRR